MTTPTLLVTPRPFDEAWTRDDSAALLGLLLAPEQHRDNEALRQAARAQARQALDRAATATYGHLLHLAQHGQLVPFAHQAGRDIETVNLWNTLANQVPFPPGQSALWAQNTFTRVFSQAFAGEFLPPSAPLRDVDRFDQALRHWARDGHFGELLFHEAYCKITGERHAIRLDGWQPRLMSVDAAHEWHPVTQDGPGTRLAVLTVDFPTGEVLVADWFRLPGFNKLDQQREDRGRPDIGCAEGRLATTQACADDGFVYVFGGGVRRLFQRDGHLCLGYPSRQEDTTPAGDLLGTVAGPINGTTLIDRAVLEALLLKADPQKTPAQIQTEVAHYVAKEEGEVLRLTIPPGTYQLYVSDQPSSLAHHFASPEVDLTHLDPICVLSDHPLPLVSTATPEGDVDAPTSRRRLRRSR